MKRNSMILRAFFFNPQGDHRMSWRHPHAPGREIFSFEYYRELAVAAESAKIDTIFVADHVAIWDTFESTVAHYGNARLEPLTLLSALAPLQSISASLGRPQVPTVSLTIWRERLPRSTISATGVRTGMW